MRGKEGCVVSQTNFTIGVRSRGLTRGLVTSSLCMISMCKSPYQALVFLSVKWELNPFLEGRLGGLAFRYMTVQHSPGHRGGKGAPHSV